MGSTHFDQANFFELFGEIRVAQRRLRIHLYLATTSIDGRQSLMIDEGNGEPPMRFQADEIQTEETTLGTLVTVKLVEKPGAWIETFSMLVPFVQVNEDLPESAVTSCGIFATHRTSAEGPSQVAGPRVTYESIPMHGTAKRVSY